MLSVAQIRKAASTAATASLLLLASSWVAKPAAAQPAPPNASAINRPPTPADAVFSEAVARAEAQLATLTAASPDKPTLEFIRALDAVADLLMSKREWAKAQPYLERALSAREAMKRPNLEIALGQFRLAYVLEEVGRFPEAWKFIESALTTREQAYPVMSLEVAEALDLAAVILRARQDYRRAEVHAKRSLEIRRHLQDPMSLDLAHILGILGGIYVDTERFGPAEPLLKEAITIRTNARATGDILIPSLWTNLARGYIDQLRSKEAIEAASTALKLRQGMRGSPASLAASHALLGEAYRTAQQYDLAEQNLNQAVKLQRDLGLESTLIAKYYYQLAELAIDQSRTRDAIERHLQALNIRRKFVARDSIAVIYSLNSLAAAHRTIRDYPAAERYIDEAIELGRNSLEPHKREIVAASLGIKVRLLLDQRRIEDDVAERLADEALTIRRKLLPDHHHNISSSLNVLASIKRAKGDFPASEKLYRESLALRVANLYEAHTQIASVHNELAGLYREWGLEKFDDAERHYDLSVGIYGKNAGESSALAVTLGNRASFYLEHKRLALARRDAQRAQAIHRKVSGAYSVASAGSLILLADIESEQGNTAEAERLLKSSLSIYKSLDEAETRSRTPPTRAAQAAATEKLARIHRKQGRMKDAKEALEAALKLRGDAQQVNPAGYAASLYALAEISQTLGQQKEADDYRQRAERIAKASLVKRQILFATDRTPERKGNCVEFGTVKSPHVTFGQAEILVTKDVPTQVQPNEEENRAAPLPAAEVTAARDFLIDCKNVTQEHRDDIVAMATDRLKRAKRFAETSMIFIHGYNNSFADALKRTAQLAGDMNFDGPIFTYSWPSTSRFYSYVVDRNAATASVRHFAELYSQVVSATGARRVHLIAHSMGSRVLLEALVGLSAEARSRIGQVILIAPDVDNRNFEPMIQSLSDLHGRITVYASKLDRPLQLSGWIGGATAGYVHSRDGALVTNGVYTIDISEAGRTFALNHFSEHQRVLRDISTTVATGRHPPDARTPGYMMLTKGKHGTYWRFTEKRAGEK